MHVRLSGSWAGLLAIGAILLLVALDPGARGLGARRESGPDFGMGVHQGTLTGNGTVVLAPREAHSNNWTLMDEHPSPFRRSSYSLAYDPDLGLGVLFGGWNGTFCNDTWTYDARTDTWTQRHPALSPPARYNAPMKFDPDSGRFILFGGYGKNPGNDTWTFDARTNVWTERSPCPEPSGSSNTPPMAYDPVIHRAIVLKTDWNEFQTWTYDISNDSWMMVRSPSSPSLRTGSSMVYDEQHRIMVLFGGEWNNTLLGDTWLLDAATLEWTERTPAASPTRRMGHAMAYDSLLGAVVLTCGVGSSAGGDTWAYFASNNTWVDQNPENYPSWRTEVGMYFDPNLDVMVLFGGWNGHTAMGDTWLFGLPSSGTYTSVPGDVGGAAAFGAIEWESMAPPGTGVSLQLRSGTSRSEMETLPFTGPDGQTDSHFKSGGEPVPRFHNGSRWVQYRALLWSVSNRTGPALSSVTIHYNLIHNITILSPAGGDVWFGIHNITWWAHDQDNDTLSFNITITNLTNPSDSRILAADLPSDAGRWTWNTSSVPDGTYNLAISAMDRNPLIPVTVTDASGVLVIDNEGGGGSKPLPTSPPRCNITSPANGSKITGNLRVCGMAAAGSLHLKAVYIRIDGGNWSRAVGLENWILAPNTDGLSSGVHRIEARAFDGANYSQPASADIIFFRSEPSISAQGDPWCPSAVVVAAAAVAAVLLVIWKNSRQR